MSRGINLNSSAKCIGISIFSNVLSFKKVVVFEMLKFVSCSAVRIVRERERGGRGYVPRSGAVNYNSIEIL
jgi:hypothetical protein